MRTFKLIALSVVFVGILPSVTEAMRTGKSLLVGLNSKCMTLERNSVENGTKVVLKNCIGRPEQQFSVQPIGEHSYEFRILGKCLDVPGGRFENRNQLQIWTCNGTPAQNFLVRGHEPLQQLVKVYGGQFCVEVQGGSTSEGTPIQLYECNGTRSQNWFAIPVQRQQEAPVAPAVGLGTQVVRREGHPPLTYETLNAMDLSLFEDSFEFEWRRGRDHTFEPWQALVPEAPMPSGLLGQITRVGKQLSARLPTLESGYVYQFRVRAKNAYGVTDSETLNRVVGIAPVPDLAVRGLIVAYAGGGQFSISWEECNLSVRSVDREYETWISISNQSPIKRSFPEGLDAHECANRSQSVDIPSITTHDPRDIEVIVTIDPTGNIEDQYRGNNKGYWPFRPETP